MVFTKRFKVLLGAFISLIVIVILFGLAINQYFLQKELQSQMKFDLSVMKTNHTVMVQLQKVATSGAKMKVSPTPTPKLLATPRVTLTK